MEGVATSESWEITVDMQDLLIQIIHRMSMILANFLFPVTCMIMPSANKEKAVAIASLLVMLRQLYGI